MLILATEGQDVTLFVFPNFYGSFLLAAFLLLSSICLFPPRLPLLIFEKPCASFWLPSFLILFSPPLFLRVVLSSIFSSSCVGQRRCVKAWECVWIAGEKGAGWCVCACASETVWVCLGLHHATPNCPARGKLCRLQKVIRNKTQTVVH